MEGSQAKERTAIDFYYPKPLVALSFLDNTIQSGSSTVRTAFSQETLLSLLGTWSMNPLHTAIPSPGDVDNERGDETYGWRESSEILQFQ